MQMSAGLPLSSGAGGAAPPRGAAAVLPWLARAAERTGVEFEALVRTARLESRFDPAARARTSSAAGLFQFIESTWLDMLARHGPKHGIAAGTRSAALALRSDPGISALMAGEHMAENRRHLEAGLGRAATSLDLYLAHFLGPGGALTFLKTLATDPERTAADVVPAAARANRAIFHGPGGAARSLADVHALLARRFGAPGWDASLTTARRPTDGDGSPNAVPDASLPSAMPPAAIRAAAQAAYLLLADLGS